MNSPHISCITYLQLVHKQMYWIRTNLQPLNVKCNIRMFILHYIMEYVGNLCSPCPLHEQPKRLMYISRLCTIQLHVCLTPLVLEESILLVRNFNACVNNNGEYI